MNDNTTKLIEELAKKLGTTSEYLWAILLKQAPISATISLLIVIGAIVWGIVILKLHIRFSKEIDGESRYESSEGLMAVPMFAAAIIFIALSVYSICEIPSIISGFFNPEYWALQEVLGSIK